MNMRKTGCSLWIAGLVMLGAAGCGRKEEATAVPSAPPPETSPATLSPAPPEKPPMPEIRYRDMSQANIAHVTNVLGRKVRPAGIIPIPELKERASEGQTVVIEAKIMGAMTPFSATDAWFLVGDEMTVASCDLLGVPERCPTPWDVHHEEPEAVAAGTAIIRITGPEGDVLKGSLRGVGGLKELRRLRIEGILAALPPESAPVINATSIMFLD